MNPLVCISRAGAAAGMLFAAMHTASAQVAATDESWRFQLTPYVWMSGLKGEIKLGSSLPTAHVSQSFSEVLKDLDAAAFVSGTARKGRHVLQGDASYSSVSGDAGLPMGLKAQAKVRQTSLTLTGGYNWELGPRDSLDVMGGIRWWDIRSHLLALPLVNTDLSKSFVDPIVAARWRHQLDSNWSTLLYADAGGFGVGSDSTWQVLAVINYEVREGVHLSAGYRKLNVDFRKQGQRLDLSLGGPVLGATFRF